MFFYDHWKQAFRLLVVDIVFQSEDIRSGLSAVYDQSSDPFDSRTPGSNRICVAFQEMKTDNKVHEK